MAEAAVQKPAENPQRIRGTAIEVFRRAGNGVSFPEALKLADEAGRVIISIRRHDKIILKSHDLRGILEVYPCWSGTMIGYEGPGARLGNTVVYVDQQTKQRYVFPSGDAKGAKDVILVAEHPDYSLVSDGKDLVVRATSVSILQNFHASDGWYGTDAVHGIPTGEQISSDREEARYFRRMNSSHVGAVSRLYYGLLGSRDGVLYSLPSVSLGVIVEAPQGAPKPKLASK